VVKNEFETVRILGSQVNLLELSDVVNCMRQWIEEPGSQCHRITVTGFHGLWEGYRDISLRGVLNSADLWVSDGIAPVFIARLKGVRNMLRIPGAELMEGFFNMANQKGYGSFFYGDTEDTLVRLRNSLEKRYPGHRVCGTLSPPFRPLTPEEDEDIVEKINDSGAHVLWVGLGLPKQERWIHAHKDRLTVPVAIGVGACFGFFSGRVKRAPQWIGRMGFEWLWRLAMEPKKLWRRDLIDGPQFLYHVALELLGFKKHSHNRDRNLIGS